QTLNHFSFSSFPLSISRLPLLSSLFSAMRTHQQQLQPAIATASSPSPSLFFSPLLFRSGETSTQQRQRGSNVRRGPPASPADNDSNNSGEAAPPSASSFSPFRSPFSSLLFFR
ncbi:hypothetical protein AABB24_035773, partial [Solanum stoloniferum]